MVADLWVFGAACVRRTPLRKGGVGMLGRDAVSQAADSTAPGDRRRRAVAAFGVFTLSLVLLLLTVWCGRLVGLADNLDFPRYTCPAGLSPDSAGKSNVVPVRLVSSSCDVGDYRSSVSPVLWTLHGVNRVLGVDGVPIRELSVVLGVVACLGWGLFAWTLMSTAGRRPAVLLLCLGMVVASTQVNFSSYFGSVYAEGLVFALAPWLLGALVLVVHRPEKLSGWLVVGLVVALIALTKPATGVLPLVVWAVICGTVLLARRRPHVVGASVVGGLAVLVFLFAATVQFPASARDVNRINLVFTAILPNTSDPVAALRAMGLQERDARALAAYSGRYVLVDQGDEKVTQSPRYGAFENDVSVARISAYLMLHPAVATRLVDVATKAIPDTRVGYLGNYQNSRGDGQRLAQRPEVINAIARLVSHGGSLATWFLWLFVAVASAVALARAHDPAGRPVPLVLLALCTLAAASLLAALGDGFQELEKHMVVAAYFNELLVGALVGLGGGFLVERLGEPYLHVGGRAAGT